MPSMLGYLRKVGMLPWRYLLRPDAIAVCSTVPSTRPTPVSRYQVVVLAFMVDASTEGALMHSTGHSHR